MTVLLWILQGILAAMFFLAGVTKATRPRDKLLTQFPWVPDVSTPVVRLIGVSEFAGALGLILPGVLGIATVLTPLAATGLVVIMALAIILHVRRKEASVIVFNAILLVTAAVVAWGRFGPYAF